MQPYADAWKFYRLRRNIAFAAIVAYLAACVYFMTGSPGMPEGLEQQNGMTVLVALFLILLLLLAWYFLFECPRCHKSFFIQGKKVSELSSSCVHCGLSKYAEGDSKVGAAT